MYWDLFVDWASNVTSYASAHRGTKDLEQPDGHISSRSGAAHDLNVNNMEEKIVSNYNYSKF